MAERCEKDGWSHFLKLLVGGRDWQTRVIYVISVIFLAIMVASDVLIANSVDIPEESKPSSVENMVKYVTFIILSLFNVYIMDCVLHGGCNWYASIVAILSIVGIVVLAIFMVIVGKSVLLMKKESESRGEIAF